jgi:hypothetical protein
MRNRRTTTGAISVDDGSAQRSAPDLGRRGDTNLVFAVEVELGTG